MGQETINREVSFCQITCNTPRCGYLHRQYFRSQFFSYPRHIVLIFLPIESAGAINQQASRFQGRPDITEYATLASPTQRHVLRAPLTDSCFILAKHPFTRARHIRQYHIEQVFQRCESRRIIIRYHHFRTAPFTEVFCQYPCTLRHYLIGYQETTFL